MIDFPAQPAMALNFAQRAMPAKAPVVAPVQDSSAAGQSALQNGGGRSQQSPTEFQRFLAQNRRDDRLIGPPPSFQTNVLDVDTDIKRTIDKLEAKREQSRNRDAAAPAENPDRARKTETAPETQQSEPAAAKVQQEPVSEPRADRLV